MAEEPIISDRWQYVIGAVISLLMVGGYLLLVAEPEDTTPEEVPAMITPVEQAEENP